MFEKERCIQNLVAEEERRETSSTSCVTTPKATPVTKESMRGFAGELDLDLRVSLFWPSTKRQPRVGYGFCRNHLQADL